MNIEQLKNVWKVSSERPMEKNEIFARFISGKYLFIYSDVRMVSNITWKKLEMSNTLQCLYTIHSVDRQMSSQAATDTKTGKVDSVARITPEKGFYKMVYCHIQLLKSIRHLNCHLSIIINSFLI